MIMNLKVNVKRKNFLIMANNNNLRTIRKIEKSKIILFMRNYINSIIVHINRKCSTFKKIYSEKSVVIR